MEFEIKQCAIILLAAGASSRMGQPKQLLPFNGKSMLRHMITTCANSKATPLLLVLGARADNMMEDIMHEKVSLIMNEYWQEGMASSIRCGIHYLIEKLPATDAAIILVCDQPYISQELLDKLIDQQKETGKPMIACTYKNSIGTPALFHKSVFPELLMLRGDRGASSLLRSQPSRVTTIPFAEGGTDIDTLDDYDKLLKKQGQS